MKSKLGIAIISTIAIVLILCLGVSGYTTGNLCCIVGASLALGLGVYSLLLRSESLDATRNAQFQSIAQEIETKNNSIMEILSLMAETLKVVNSINACANNTTKELQKLSHEQNVGLANVTTNISEYSNAIKASLSEQAKTIAENQKKSSQEIIQHAISDINDISRNTCKELKTALANVTTKISDCSKTIEASHSKISEQIKDHNSTTVGSLQLAISEIKKVSRDTKDAKDAISTQTEQTEKLAESFGDLLENLNEIAEKINETNELLDANTMQFIGISDAMSKEMAQLSKALPNLTALSNDELKLIKELERICKK